MGLSPWDLPMPYNSNHSNLQYFLECVTPNVSTRPLQGFLKTVEKDKLIEGFSLSEVWECYTEWSAYGAGVPIVLNPGERVVQYYSPSLSALQIYTTKPFSTPTSNLFNQIDDDKFWEMGNRAESEKGSCCNYSKGQGRDNSTCLGSNAANWDNHSTTFQFGSSCECPTQTTDPFGYLYCQYNEMASPYDRVPLKPKINELSKDYPGLLDLHSTDLSPYSWMAIAWYPVYQIPVARNVKELCACFLTYHPLISCLSQGAVGGDDDKLKSGRSSGGREEETSLPPFAVVTYRMFGTLWINPETSDQESIICRQTAACYWLKQLQFHHHDFNFFMSRQCQNY